MSGYLQNGEAVVMKLATIKWLDKLKNIEGLDFKLVNFVHDEWQTEVNNNMELALRVAQSQADALREVGEELKLKCPLAGSFWNDDHHDYTIGTNWYQTH
jgi:DNA polymerase I-like protein with 3'-5' exonuclease and polymerase domains